MMSNGLLERRAGFHAAAAGVSGRPAQLHQAQVAHHAARVEFRSGPGAAGPQVLDWNDFDVFAVARLSRGRPLQTVTWALLQHFDLIDSLSLPQDKLRRFLKVRCGRGGPPPRTRQSAGHAPWRMHMARGQLLPAYERICASRRSLASGGGDLLQALRCALNLLFQERKFPKCDGRGGKGFPCPVTQAVIVIATPTMTTTSHGIKQAMLQGRSGCRTDPPNRTRRPAQPVRREQRRRARCVPLGDGVRGMFLVSNFLFLKMNTQIVQFLIFILTPQTVEAHYNRNPYHNSQHAADVTQNVGVLLAADGLADQLSQLEVLACILAACVHDVKHPGAPPPPPPPPDASNIREVNPGAGGLPCSQSD